MSRTDADFDFAVKQGDAAWPCGVRYETPELAAAAARVGYRVQTSRYRYSGELPVGGGWMLLPPSLPAGEVFFADVWVEWSDGDQSIIMPPGSGRGLVQWKGKATT